MSDILEWCLCELPDRLARSGPFVVVVCEGYRMVFVSICEHASTAYFLRARAVIKFVLQAASTLKNTTGEQRILR